MVGSRVYVGGLPYGVRERDLERFFKGYGRTRDILIKNGYGFVEFDDYRDADDAVYELNGKELLGERVIVEAARGHARGNGYGRDRYDDRFGRRGRYGDKVSVERARGTPRGSDQWRNDRRGGSKYPPQRRRSRDNYNNDRSRERYGPPTRTEYRLTVENLSSRVSWQDLKDYMRQAGEVTYADAHKQRRNEGVVEFATLADMKTAIEKLDDTDLNGRRIRLIEDRRRGSRRSRSSSSRSRSRSRRRSRSRSSRSRSRSRSRGKSKSKSPARSRSRDAKSHDRSKSKSRSRSPSAKRDDSRSPSKSKAKSLSRDRSRSRSRSGSKANSKSKSRSVSPSKNESTPDRNESMED
ncbi:serine-arginine protein 55-like isoform X2 [Ctenocephalides felis]|uniref:serine-arginine protein 55-like isoform X2 n=1 Tax=Ctenocephalides felis TaxID=7515 RepID=UPI000E6E3B6D|nr:serine-arginine protein 55-like isoform X2 [Ctenocephalides felis]